MYRPQISSGHISSAFDGRFQARRAPRTRLLVQGPSASLSSDILVVAPDSGGCEDVVALSLYSLWPITDHVSDSDSPAPRLLSRISCGGARSELDALE